MNTILHDLSHIFTPIITSKFHILWDMEFASEDVSEFASKDVSGDMADVM